MTATRRPSVNEGRLDQHCRGVGEGVTVAEERALASVAEAEARRREEREDHAFQESVSEEQRQASTAISGACSSLGGS